MLSGSKLGNDAAIRSVNVVLGSDEVREDLAPVSDYRRRGLIARAFDTQNKDRRFQASLRIQRNDPKLSPSPFRC
jgi:hypothetical protein